MNARTAIGALSIALTTLLAVVKADAAADRFACEEQFGNGPIESLEIDPVAGTAHFKESAFSPLSVSGDVVRWGEDGDLGDKFEFDRKTEILSMSVFGDSSGGRDISHFKCKRPTDAASAEDYAWLVGRWTAAVSDPAGMKRSDIIAFTRTGDEYRGIEQNAGTPVVRAIVDAIGVVHWAVYFMPDSSPACVGQEPLWLDASVSANAHSINFRDRNIDPKSCAPDWTGADWHLTR